MSNPDSELPLRIADLEAIRGLLIELLTHSASPNGSRECQAWALLADCQQLMSAAMINLGKEEQTIFDDYGVYSGEEDDHKLYVKLYRNVIT